MAGAATQIFSAEFDAAVMRLQTNAAVIVMNKINDMGRRLDSFPHYRMSGRKEFRLRVGDYRVIYDFDLSKNELFLVTLGILVNSSFNAGLSV